MGIPQLSTEGTQRHAVIKTSSLVLIDLNSCLALPLPICVNLDK